MHRDLFQFTCLALGVTVLAVACAPTDATNEVTVGGLDYAFEAPDTLPPGPTAFHFENRGEVRHELILVRLQEGVTMEDVLTGLQEGADSEEFVEGGLGILVVRAGQSSANRLLVDLMPGRTYALICNLRDSPEAQPHTALGMRDSFYVREAAG